METIPSGLTLEQSMTLALLSRKGHPHQIQRRESWIGYRVSRIPAWVSGIVLLLLSVTGFRWFVYSQWMGALFEALLIAGILCISVDPFLKRQLLREVNQELFVHLVGYDLPQEIKDRLKDTIFGLKLYAVDKRINCEINPCGENQVSVKVTETYDLVNPTPQTQAYTEWAAFEKAELPKRCVVRGRSGDVECSAQELYEPPDDLGILRVDAKKVPIPPTTQGPSWHFSREYELLLPHNHFLHLYQKLPVIGIWVRVSAPGFVIQSKHTNSYECVHDKLFLTGEQITLRWRPADGLHAT